MRMNAWRVASASLHVLASMVATKSVGFVLTCIIYSSSDDVTRNATAREELTAGGQQGSWEMIMRNIWKSGCVAAAMLVAPPALAQAVSADTYVMKAGAGDLYEKTSSQLVLETTSNPSVKSFANMMVSDHSASTAKVKAAAAKSGITPKPPVLAPKQQAMITALKAAKGTSRDTLYITQQKAAHQDALALHKTYSMSGSAAPLKSVASEIVPVVEHHIEMLNTMK